MHHRESVECSPVHIGMRTTGNAFVRRPEERAAFRVGYGDASKVARGLA